ncbi:3-aminobutyryl-CoA ammonia lyase [Clavibacter michiganensis]|uniref:3-aminobutyryl-CoA ammonia lyase n=1 Tax=Clavibacter michiganensis TaxID=28447 RepID=A0A251YEH1_9MICO|nr:hypothetical protein [Clavibacter michiganensis]OUE22647.1 3-aminobutyryl-CoA ammonia lyase [Clavibacter michiganensis]
MERVLLVRVPASAAHYGGGLVDGAFVLRLFGDALTFVSCRDDGDEGLLASYVDVQFSEPVSPGDFLAIACGEESRTRLSRTYSLVATRQGRLRKGQARASAAEARMEVGPAIATATARVVVPVAAVREAESRAPRS